MNLSGGMAEYRVVSCIGQIIIGADTALRKIVIFNLFMKLLFLSDPDRQRAYSTGTRHPSPLLLHLACSKDRTCTGISPACEAGAGLKPEY
jgi:hypothetical protein